jgi:RNA polymerase sigma factor (sigma-70 family)
MGQMNDSEIYLSVRRDLMRYATALAGADAADDVVSTVVTRVVARPGGLGSLREPKQYLMRSVLNEIRNRHRANRQRATQSIGVPNTGVQPDHGGVSDVVDAIEQLPVRQRAAAFLVFHQGFTPAEAAGLMGCRPGTVRRYLHLARAKLREALDG